MHGHTPVIMVTITILHVFSSSNDSMNMSDFIEVLAQASHVETIILTATLKCFNSSTYDYE